MQVTVVPYRVDRMVCRGFYPGFPLPRPVPLPLWHRPLRARSTLPVPKQRDVAVSEHVRPFSLPFALKTRSGPGTSKQHAIHGLILS
jgi:hypothetical protein